MGENFLSKPFSVTKILDFCYAHRLLNYDGKCKNLHGHHAQVEITIAADTLDNRGMVIDFKEIKEKLKPWIDEHLDHRTLLCEADPFVPLLKNGGEPFFLMRENPTAENIAKLIFEQAKRVGLKPEKVRLWETPDSFADYRGPL